MKKHGDGRYNEKNRDEVREAGKSQFDSHSEGHCKSAKDSSHKDDKSDDKIDLGGQSVKEKDGR